MENILALDPASYKNMGVCVACIDNLEEMSILTSYTKIFDVDKVSKDERFMDLASTLNFIIKEYNITSIVFERTSFGLKFVMAQIYENIGVTKYIAQSNGVKIIEVSPKTAKKNLTGSGKATKKQMMDTVMNKFNIKKSDLTSEHEADAISMAYTYSLIRKGVV